MRHLGICSRLTTAMTIAVLLLVFSAALPQGARASELNPASTVPEAYTCGYSEVTDSLLSQLTLESWMGWIRRLSGADPLVVSGQTYTITTRLSEKLFNGESPAYDYILETLTSPGWYPIDQVEEDPYQPYAGSSETWKNLILTIPGSLYPDEVVILSAHLDSIGNASAAPGADDNATGSAALLEAARVLRSASLPRTVKLIWFTGEEQIMLGSKAYLNDPIHPERLSGIVGVINMDMYGYDADHDGCFELHISPSTSAAHFSASQRVASCFVTAMRAYQINLTYDYLTSGASPYSDHSSFWDKGIGAVEVLENFYVHTQPNGCTGADRNPNYHTGNDRIEYLNPDSGFEITRAGLAAAFSLANPVPVIRYYLPLVKN